MRSLCILTSKTILGLVEAMQQAISTCNIFIPVTVKSVESAKSKSRQPTQAQTSMLPNCVCVCVCFVRPGCSCLNEPIVLVCVLWEDKRIKGDSGGAITVAFLLRKFSPKSLCRLWLTLLSSLKVRKRKGRGGL